MCALSRLMERDGAFVVGSLFTDHSKLLVSGSQMQELPVDFYQELLSCRAETRHFTEAIVSQECLVSARQDNAADCLLPTADNCPHTIHYHHS